MKSAAELSTDAAVVELVDSSTLPVAGDRWNGSRFLDLNGGSPDPDYAYFAFVVDGACVLVQPIKVETGVGLIAAYRSGVTFEVTSGQEV